MEELTLTYLLKKQTDFSRMNEIVGESFETSFLVSPSIYNDTHTFFSIVVSIIICP